MDTRLHFLLCELNIAYVKLSSETNRFTSLHSQSTTDKVDVDECIKKMNECEAKITECNQAITQEYIYKNTCTKNNEQIMPAALKMRAC